MFYVIINWTNKNMPILKWTAEEKLALATRQLAILNEIKDDPLLSASAEYMPEITLRYEQAPYLYYQELWNIWLFSAGRGSGKTFAGVRWVLYEIEHAEIPLIFSIVSPTNNDIVRVIIEGDSGFLRNTPSWLGMTWRKSDNVLFFKNGSVIRMFSAESPERMRGFNGHKCWADEIAAWPIAKIKETMHQITLSNRLTGTRNQVAITTTPMNIPYLRQLMTKDIYNQDVIFTTGSTYDNAQHLGEAFMQNIKKLEGTSFGRQEVYGELIDLEGTQNFEEDDFQIWRDGCKLPKFHKIIIGLDGAFTENTKNDPTGCVVLGVFFDPKINDWAVLILDCWEKWLNFNDLVDFVKIMWDTEYGADIEPGKYPDVFAIEWAASGIPLIQHLLQYKNKAGEPINIVKRSVRAGGSDKYSRISLACPFVKAGRVYVMGGQKTKFAPWVETLITQLVEIRHTEHDDIADAFTHALLYLNEIDWINTPFEDRKVPCPDYVEPYSDESYQNPYGV